MRLFVTIILVAAAVIVFFFPTRSILDSAQPLEEERTALEEALGNAKRIRAERDKLQEKYNSFKTEDIEKLHKLLPSHVDTVRLILDINTIAAAHGMRLDNVKVDSIDRSNTPKSAVIAPSSSKFATLNLSFSVTSNYFAFKQFLADLEQSLRIVDVTSLAFSVAQPNMYIYGVTLKTYWLASPQLP